MSSFGVILATPFDFRIGFIVIYMRCETAYRIFSPSLLSIYFSCLLSFFPSFFLTFFLSFLLTYFLSFFLSFFLSLKETICGYWREVCNVLFEQWTSHSFYHIDIPFPFYCVFFLDFIFYYLVISTRPTCHVSAVHCYCSTLLCKWYEAAMYCVVPFLLIQREASDLIIPFSWSCLHSYSQWIGQVCSWTSTWWHWSIQW